MPGRRSFFFFALALCKGGCVSALVLDCAAPISFDVAFAELFAGAAAGAEKDRAIAERKTNRVNITILFVV